MEDSSRSKLGRQSVVTARSKGQRIGIFKRGSDHLAENERRHEFSLDSLDKEILQTMSRGSKNTHVSLPSDSAREWGSGSSGSAQEKAICSRKSIHPEQIPYSYPSPEYKRHQNKNGVLSSESTSKTSKKPSEQHHGTGNIGQFHTPQLSMWPEADARPNGYKQQVSVNVNGGKHQQDPGHWHHAGGTLHSPGGNNEILVGQLKDLSFRDVHSVNNRLDAGISSDTSGEDIGEESGRKQASEGPYSGSMVGRSQQRSAMNSKVSKMPPSKWDDADKWIASPGHIDSAAIHSAHSNQSLVPSPLLLPGKRLTAAGQALEECNEPVSPNLAASIVDSSFSPNNNGNTSSIIGSTTPVRVKDHIQQIESVIQDFLPKNPPVTDLAKRREAPRAAAKCADNKRGDTSVITSTMFVQRPKDSRLDGLISPPKLLIESQAAQNPVSIFPTEKPPLAETPTDALVKDIFSNGPLSSSMSDFPSSISVKEPSSCYRDMGTQMTPNPSVRLSRGATAGAFNVSPGRHNTPDHSRRTTLLGAPANADLLDLQSFRVEKPGQRNVGSQPHPLLDRNLNWSTREEEEEESATCLTRTRDCGEMQTSPFVAWAAAWEEAERAKYTARFYQEEARIQAWEEHQNAKAEAKMRKVEVKLEKIHEIASQKMSNKIAAAHRKAEDMRNAAEACHDELATKAMHRAEYIRQTGNVPTAFGCFASRLVPFQSNLQ